MANHIDEIKEEAYWVVEEQLQTLFSQSSEQEIPNFRSQCFHIFTDAINHYTSFAVHSNQEIKDIYKHELETQIRERLFLCFIHQVEFIKDKSLESFILKLTEIEARPLKEILPTIQQTLNALENDNIDSFQSRTAALFYEGSEWENIPIKNRQELKALQSIHIKNCIDSLLKKAQHQQKE